METLSILIDALPYIAAGMLITAVMVIMAMLVGLVIGIPLAVCQVYGGVVTRKAAGVYIWFFRGVPVLVLMFLVFFGIFGLIESFYNNHIMDATFNLGPLGIITPRARLNIPPFWAAVMVLGLVTAAYQSQIFRGAIQALPQGQMNAAKALGFTETKAIRTIILPQALRLSIPAWSNEYSIILKDSAVAFALGTMEIMARTHFVASRTYQHLPLYILAGLLYFILTWIGVKALLQLERKVHIPGYGNQQELQL